jgi:arylsulfatase A-like enzyme
MEGWLERSEGQPLFLWLHVFDAHTPYEPPPPYDRRYWDGPDPFAKEGGSPPPRRVVQKSQAGLSEKEFPHAQYRAEIDFLDEQIGRLLERPRIRSGIVAFTADHGESFGEHGIWYSHTGLYPQTTGVPLILSWPGGPRGKRCEELVSHLDLGRTLLVLAGHEAAEFPGRDLRRVLGDSPTIEPHFEISADHCSAAVQTERHRLVLHLRNYHKKSMITRRRLHEVELYDTLADPRCEVNLVREEEHYETAKGLRALLIRWLENASTDGLRASAVQSVELMTGLEALGYTQGSGGGESQVFYEEDPEDEWCDFFSR